MQQGRLRDVLYADCANTSAYVAAMDGVDAIVFTGGIGGDPTCVRTYERLTFFGVELDEEANAQVREGCITKPGPR